MNKCHSHCKEQSFNTTEGKDTKRTPSPALGAVALLGDARPWMTAPHPYAKHCPESVCLLRTACGLPFKTRFMEQFANTLAQPFALAETLQQKVSAPLLLAERDSMSTVCKALFLQLNKLWLWWTERLGPLLSKQWARQMNMGTVAVKGWILLAVTKKSRIIHFGHCRCCVGAPRGQCAVSLSTPRCGPAAAAAAPFLAELLLGRRRPAGVSRSGISVPQFQQDNWVASLTPFTFLSHFWAPSNLVLFGFFGWQSNCSLQNVF